jgi:hypothetical protein
MPSLSKLSAVLPVLASLLLLPISVTAQCNFLSNVKMTNYGWDDNSPPGANIAYTCSRPGGSDDGTTVSPPTSSPTGSPTDTSPSPSPSVGSGNGSGNGGRGKGRHHRHEPPNNRRWASKRGSTPQAGGVGTYADPLTMASSSSLFTPCTIFYVPRLQKYVIFEDDCVQCDQDASDGITHIDIWTGSNTSAGGQGLLSCEDSYTPSDGQVLIQDPPSTLPVDCKFQILCTNNN